MIEALAASLEIALVSAAIAGALGIVAAWLISRTDVPGRTHAAGLLQLPYAIPPYLLGMAWVVLGNPTVGLLRSVLPGSGSYGFWGITLVLASVTFAFPYLELRAGFERMDPALEEAARVSGAAPWRVFRDVSLPLLWPALLNGMVLAFLYSLSAFGVPALLGLPVRKFVLTTLIYSQLKMGGVQGLGEGMKLSLVLLGIAAIALGVSALLSRVSRGGGALSGGKSSKMSQVRLGAWRLPAGFAVWGLFGVTVLLPWVALGLSALAPMAGKFSPSGWTLKNLRYIFTLADFQSAAFNSLVVATLTAAIVCVVGFLLGYYATRRRSRLAQAVIGALGFPFATPGTVLAIVLLYLNIVGGGIFQPLMLIGAAYVIKYAAVGARSMRTAFAQVDPVLEEAARVAGASRAQLLWTIWFPLLKRSLGAAFLLAFLPMLTELTMSILLTGPGAATLGTVLFDLQEYADQPSAAAMAWLLLTVAIIVGRVTRRRG